MLAKHRFVINYQEEIVISDGKRILLLNENSSGDAQGKKGEILPLKGLDAKTSDSENMETIK